MSDKKRFAFYLGDVPNEAIAFLEYMNSKNICILTLMEKMGLGDPNRIYIAKILTKNNKEVKLKWN